MALQLDLRKSEETLKLCLAKVGVHTPPVVEVAFNMDVSGSFRDEHMSGDTNILMNRLVPWGMVFDPDKKLDFFSFSDGPSNVQYVGEVTAENCEDFIKSKVINKVQGWMGGTDYSYVIKENLIIFGWEKGNVSGVVKEERTSVLGSIGNLFGFGKKEKSSIAPADNSRPRKSLIIHVTDGETEDERATYDLLANMERNGYKVYVQFFGMGLRKGSRGDKYLNKLAEDFSNVGYCRCDSVRNFNALTDEEINDLIISDELVKWLTA